MPLYRLSELLPFLESLGRGSKRTLSQNFLIDGNCITKIIQASGVSSGDVVIEIGPGPGALTEALLLTGASVVAVEIDRDFAKALPRLQGSLTVINEDILSLSFHELKEQYSPQDKPVHIVSNLPYHLTKEILRHIATTCPHPFEATLMVQEEVARKITSSTPEESFMTLELALYGTFSYLFPVSKSCFFPMPKVNSAVISYRSHMPRIEPESRRRQFRSLLAFVYQQRRKSIVHVLKERGKIDEWLLAQGLTKTARPDELSLDAWIKLFHFLET